MIFELDKEEVVSSDLLLVTRPDIGFLKTSEDEGRRFGNIIFCSCLTGSCGLIGTVLDEEGLGILFLVSFSSDSLLLKAANIASKEIACFRDGKGRVLKEEDEGKGTVSLEDNEGNGRVSLEAADGIFGIENGCSLRHLLGRK